MLAFALSFIFMYMVLAAQFESFIHPVTILLTLPLAIPFGIVSLLVTGQTVNIFSGLGILLLFGIVKKNAILQIDHTNELRAHGHGASTSAIIQANRDRLRPILMTTIALVAGMMPLIISQRRRARHEPLHRRAGCRRPIALLAADALAVPVFYSLFDDVGRSRVFARAWSRVGGTFAWVRRRATATAHNVFWNYRKAVTPDVKVWNKAVRLKS